MQSKSLQNWLQILSLLFLGLWLVNGCHSVHETRKGATLVGQWKSKPYLSQLGKIVSYYSFSDDGEFFQEINMLDAKIKMAEKGTFYFDDKYIYVVIKKLTRKVEYVLRKDVLIIIDGPDMEIKMYRE